MVKKIFIVELEESDRCEKSLSSGMVLHALLPTVSKVYEDNEGHSTLRSIKVNTFLEV